MSVSWWRVGFVGAALVASLALATSVAFAAAPQRSQPFYFADPDHTLGELVPDARAQLGRTPNGISAQINTRDLDRGAYTVWWIVWNDPSECTNGCGEDDLGVPGNFVGFATGGGVGASGNGGFGASLRVGDEGVPGETLLVSNDGMGLTDPADAEVHLVVRYHGPIVPAEMPGQIKTFAGACTPGSSLGIGDGAFDCLDVQAVMFLAP